MPIKLACFEVDNTILNFALQDELQNRHRHISPEEAKIAHLEERLRVNSPGIRHAESLKQTMHDLLDKGVGVAITSYTPYQNLLPAVVDAIGLSEEDRQKIKIITPTKPGWFGSIKDKKLEEMVQEASGCDLPEKEVAFVSYSPDLRGSAESAGYHAIRAGRNGEADISHLNELRALAGLEALAAPEVPVAFNPNKVDWAARKAAAARAAETQPRPQSGHVL